MDPLAEEYANISSYVYCLNNPILYIDPDGRKVEADRKSQTNIKNSLTGNEAKYVVFGKNGDLDKEELNKSKSNSANMTALKVQANSKTIYSYEVVDKYVDATGRIWVLKDDPKKGTVGLTSVPHGEEAPSRDNKVHILVSNKANERQQTSTTAHEGYGHAYFYELSKNNKGIDPWHRYGLIRTDMVYDPYFKRNIPVGVQGKINLNLENRIKKVVKQALNNYESKK